MDIRQLRYFQALASELHFKRAADQLFIVQPALSRQIKVLEEDLGVLLLERNQRNVSLTPAGAYLKAAIEPLLARFSEIRTHIILVAEGLEGELRIGYTGSCVHTVLPPLLHRLHERFPGIQTYLSELTSSVQLDALLARQLDIGFLRNPPPHALFETLLVWREPFYLVVPLDHPLRRLSDLKQVASEPFILPARTDGVQYHEHILGICTEAGVHPRVAHETTHGTTVVKLVENGLGVSILPETFKKLHEGRVRFLPLRHTQRQAELTAVWRKEDAVGTLARLLGLLQKGRGAQKSTPKVDTDSH